MGNVLEGRNQYGRADCMPVEGRTYTLDELLEVLFVEVHIRELIDSFDEEKLILELKNLHQGGRIKFYQQERYLRMIIVKVGDGYCVQNIYACVPSNPRAGCSAPSAGDQRFGYGFMALGGNSYVSSGWY